jgi:hypothetical protein
LLRAGPCLPRCFLAKRRSNPLQYFTVSDSRLSQTGGPGPRIYIPREQDGIKDLIGFYFCKLVLSVVPFVSGFTNFYYLYFISRFWRI